MRAITVCVGYDDLLAITLPRNARHFEEHWIVTHPTDQRTLAVVDSVGHAWAYRTDAFYRDGAPFRKGLAIEECFGHIGRDGWFAVVDADTLLPDDFAARVANLDPERIYAPRRRMCSDPRRWCEPWEQWPIQPDCEQAGFAQVFCGESRFIRDKRPWYGTEFRHAGGCDSVFLYRWPPEFREWLPFECLHLGRPFENWCGRTSPRLDGTLPDGYERNAASMARLMEQRRREGCFSTEIPRE